RDRFARSEVITQGFGRIAAAANPRTAKGSTRAAAPIGLVDEATGGLTMHAAYEHFREGGWGMWRILLWSIIPIGIIVERALYLFGSSINKDVFLATMQKC